MRAYVQRGVLAAGAALERIVDLTRAHGGRIVVFFLNQLNRRIEQRALERLRELSADRGVPVVDTLGFFAGQPFPALVNHGFRDPHPNAHGHALLAEGIARVLRVRGWLPR